LRTSALRRLIDSEASTVRTSAEGAAAAAAGADFLVMLQVLPEEVLAGLCLAVPVPVFAREISLSAAWEIGVSGTNEIAG